VEPRRGATRFQYRRGEEYGPHGDTHLRAVKQFDPEGLVNGFNETTDRLLSVIASETSFRRPVTAAIDITTIPYYGEVEEMPMVSGTKERDGRAFKFATLSIIGQNIPLIFLSSRFERVPSGMRTRRIRSIVLCDSSFDERKSMFQSRPCCVIESFDSIQVFQTLSNLDVNYLIPKRVSSSERDVLEQMEEDDQEVAVESASVHVESGSHPMRLLYVPSTSGEGQPSSRRISESVPRKLRRSVSATVAGGKSRASTNRSRATFSPRPPRKTTAFACSTSCLPYSCTISGGSPTSC